jgi:DNA-binding HxlR family transcriptional regulator
MAGDSKLCAAYLAAMDVLAKPWSGMLLAVLEGGPLRFSEVADRVPAIGDRMLTARLKELEQRGLVVRSVDPGPPVRVSYELTEVGRGFHDVAEAIERWGRTILRAQEAAVVTARPRTRRSA